MISKVMKAKVSILLTTVFLISGCIESGKIVQTPTPRKEVFFSGSKMIDLGGYKLHINSKGGPEGETIVMDAGLNNSTTSWKSIEDQVSKFARVITYDRAGNGISEGSLKPKRSMYMADDLHELLVKAGVKAPFILVGHSFGGANVRVFAARYPGEVKSLLLIDSSNEFHLEENMATMSASDLVKTKESFEGLECSFVEFKNSLFEAKRANKALEDMPMIVVAAGKKKDWIDASKKLSEVSSKGRFVTAEDSGHFIQDDKPDLIIKLLKELVEEAK